MRPECESALASLHRGVVNCRRCRLAETRTHAVPGEGPCDASIMFIGEAPGKTEDLEGRPFCGRSGRFFNELLASVGISRDSVYVTSSVKCRPPGNRDPSAEELATCRAAWLENQIRIINPGLVVLLGRIALKQVLERTDSLRDLHGKLFHQNERVYLPTYHPAAGQRFRDVRHRMLSDFNKIRHIFHAGV